MVAETVRLIMALNQPNFSALQLLVGNFSVSIIREFLKIVSSGTGRKVWKWCVGGDAEWKRVNSKHGRHVVAPFV